jgi:RES domain-containing protein
MRTPRKVRDPDLLDALEALTAEAFEGEVWRIVRQGRDPLLGYPAGARWDPPGGFDVLYTALRADGARAEIYFHLNRAPVFPSGTTFLLHRIDVRTRRTLRLADLGALAALGVDVGRYAEVNYRQVPTRTQEIGDAAFFLGFDGLIVPSARYAGDNLVLFLDRLEPERDLAVLESAPVDWEAWRR